MEIIQDCLWQEWTASRFFPVCPPPPQNPLLFLNTWASDSAWPTTTCYFHNNGGVCHPPPPRSFTANRGTWFQTRQQLLCEMISKSMNNVFMTHITTRLGLWLIIMQLNKTSRRMMLWVRRCATVTLGCALIHYCPGVRRERMAFLVG